MRLLKSLKNSKFFNFNPPGNIIPRVAVVCVPQFIYCPEKYTMTEVINQENSKKRLTQDELTAELAYFTGTEQWYMHWARSIIYTEGVQFFAENGGDQGAYWFLDKVACEIAPLLKSKKERFGCVTLSSNAENQAVILVTDGNDNELAKYQIRYTDMQPGNWKFYLIDDLSHLTLLLPSEY